MNPANSRVLLLGPKKSGKTTLISALEEVILHGCFPKSLYHFNVHLNTPALRERSRDFRRLWETGVFRPESTPDVVEYQFELEGERFGKPPMKWRCVMDMPDSSGEASLGECDTQEMIDQRKKLIPLLQNATGLIVCLPQCLPDDPTYTAENRVRLTHNFLKLLDELPAKEKMPWHYIAFALTKMDVFFSQFQSDALRTANISRSVENIEARLMNEGADQRLIRRIRSRCEPGVRFAAGYTSIFGFTPDGRMNYDPTTEGLLLRLMDSCGQHRIELASPRDFQTSWMPYQILDPFVYAMSGELFSNARPKSPSEPLPASQPASGFIEVFREDTRA